MSTGLVPVGPELSVVAGCVALMQTSAADPATAELLRPLLHHQVHASGDGHPIRR